MSGKNKNLPHIYVTTGNITAKKYVKKQKQNPETLSK